MLSEKNFDIVKRVADKFGLPRYIWEPIINYESNGDPKNHTVTGKEDSRGLFQVNIKAHPDANPLALFDTEYNATYQIPELKRFFDKGVAEGLEGAELTKYVARYGQRPDWKDPKNVSYIEGVIDEYFGNSVDYSNVTGFATTENVKNFVGGGFNWLQDFKKVGVYYLVIIIVMMFSFYIVFVKK